jgi:hypothetical protein
VEDERVTIKFVAESITLLIGQITERSCIITKTMCALSSWKKIALLWDGGASRNQCDATADASAGVGSCNLFLGPK